MKFLYTLLFITLSMGQFGKITEGDPPNFTLSNVVAINNVTVDVTVSQTFPIASTVYWKIGATGTVTTENGVIWAEGGTVRLTVSALSPGSHTFYIWGSNQYGTSSTRTRAFTYTAPATPDFMDDLTYTYAPGSNKLTRVHDATPANGFSDDFDSNTASTQYEYDENGNVKKDLNRGITLIKYNHQNLPVEIQRAGKSTIYYTYDDLGQRIEKKIGSTVVSIYVRDDAGNIIVELDGNYNMVSRPIYGRNDDLIGQEYKNGSITDRYYNIKDHLGNVRVTFKENGNLERAQSYYPFGGALKRTTTNDARDKWSYQSKENDVETAGSGNDGLDYFEARYHDNAIGRFYQTDPLGEMFNHQNPYTSMDNGPINTIDPTGMCGQTVNHFGAGWDVVGDPCGSYSAEFQNPPLYGPEHFKNENFDIQEYVEYNKYYRNNNKYNSSTTVFENAFARSMFLIASSSSLLENRYTPIGANTWRGINGKYYPVRWGGNGTVGTRADAFTTAKIMNKFGKYTFYLGALYSIGKGAHAYNTGDNATVAKSGLDLGIGAYSVWGGPLGIAAGVIYTGVDVIFPGGWKGALDYRASIADRHFKLTGESMSGANWKF